MANPSRVQSPSDLTARIVWLTDIIRQGSTVHFRFQYDGAFSPISTAEIVNSQKELGIETQRFGEMSRTHWAVKDVNLLAWATAKGYRLSHPEAPPPPPKAGGRVFVVHGTNEAMKHAVTLYLTRIGLVPIILHEELNAGRTLISKFIETAATADFAVVLMSGDDVGGPSVSTLQARARQNVVFELGFFLSSLGPEKVAALIPTGIEKPSDFQGVVYIQYEGGSWKNDLARELAGAGLAVDFEAAVRS